MFDAFDVDVIFKSAAECMNLGQYMNVFFHSDSFIHSYRLGDFDGCKDYKNMTGHLDLADRLRGIVGSG